MTFTLFSLCVRSLEIRFVKMVSSAYTVIFSFSNADNSFAEKGFTRILLHDSSLCSLYKTQNKLFFIHHFWRRLLTRIILLAGNTIGRLADFITVSSPDFGLNLGTVNT